MKKLPMTFLFILISNVLKKFNPYRRTSLDIFRLKMAVMYVKGVETFRLLFGSLLGIGLALILLIGGFILFHVALLGYTPWSMQTKMYIAFSCAALYFLIASVIISEIFSQSKWLEIFHAKNLIDDLTKNTETFSEDSSLKEQDNGNGKSYRETAESRY